MPVEQRQGLITWKSLSEREIAEIMQLVHICNAHENIHLRIILRSLYMRSGESYNDFLYYKDNQLIGYIGLDGDGDEGELMGMVHPAYRRHGIFRVMLNALYEECRQRGIQRLIFVCEYSSPSGQAFIQSLADKVTLLLAEHEMLLTDYSPRAIVGERVEMRLMDREDVDAAVSIAVAGGEDAETTRAFFIQCIKSPGERLYLGILHTQPIGMLRLVEMGDRRIGIYTFNMHPIYRGRGYGRQMLQDAIQIAQAEQAQGIMLEVDVENTNALGLYRSVGFTVKTTYEYYQMYL